MPRKDIDYSKTVIYKIQHIEKDDLLYVGHTTCFKNRKDCHKRAFNNPKTNHLKVYQLILENGGWDKFIMLEIEKYPCNDGNEARAEENKIYKELKANMNMVNPFRSKEDTKIYQSEYYKANKDKLDEYYKKQRMEKYDEYREKSLEYKKIHKKELAEQQLQSHTCFCGINYTQCNKLRHLKSIKHKSFVEGKESISDEIKKNKKQEYNIKFRRENKELMLIRDKENYEKYKVKNQERRKMQVSCICGCFITKHAQRRHEQTIKHIKFIEEQTSNE